MGDDWVGLSPPYQTVVVDPPWQYLRKRSVFITSPGRHERKSRPDAGSQYSTMSVTQIADMPVVDLVGENAHLYLWTTNPLMPSSYEVMRAWGFDYITTITWVKTSGAPGLGFYFRGDTEHVLFGKRGKLPIPPERRESNVILAPRSGHSRKPGAFGDMVERVSPGPYVELFARQPRLGWDSWGMGHESNTGYDGEEP